MRTAPLQLERPSRRSPGSRARNVPTCQGLRPRRVIQALALSRLSVSPSANLTASAPRTNLLLSRLDGWPAGSPVNASSRTSRCATHDSGPVWFAIPFLLETSTLYSLPISRRTNVRFFPFGEVKRHWASLVGRRLAYSASLGASGALALSACKYRWPRLETCLELLQATSIERKAS